MMDLAVIAAAFCVFLMIVLAGLIRGPGEED